MTSKEKTRIFQMAVNNWHYVVVILVPIIFCPLPIIFNDSIGYMAYCIIIMAIYWMTECLPLAATALLPILLFPLFGIQTSREVCSNYFNDTIILFFGGLMVAASVEHWNLHKRIALRVLILVGSKPRWLLLGFMSTTAFLSMWMSNTATTAMMIPIAQAFLAEIKPCDNEDDLCGEDNKGCGEVFPCDKGPREMPDEVDVVEVDDVFRSPTVEKQEVTRPAVALKTIPLRSDHVKDSSRTRSYKLLCKGVTLSIPYTANIGGIATLTGCGPTVFLSAQVESRYGSVAGVNFGTWMMYAFPGMVVCLLASWMWLQVIYLDCFCFRRSARTIGNEQEEKTKMVIRKSYAALGKMSFAEWAVLGHFIILVILWLTRDPKFVSGWSIGFLKGYVTDATSVIFISLLLFTFPSRPPAFLCRGDEDVERDENPSMISPLLTWPVIREKMAWSVIILLGGGSALADACEASGLSTWLGAQLSVFSGVPPAGMATIILIIVASFTEITSNTATATIFLPIFADLSVRFGVNPLYFLFPATIACSFSFMLPVSSPPSAIAYAVGNLSVLDMVKTGLVMKIICILVTSLSINTLGVWIFDVSTYPDWANATAVPEG